MNLCICIGEVLLQMSLISICEHINVMKMLVSSHTWIKSWQTLTLGIIPAQEITIKNTKSKLSD